MAGKLPQIFEGSKIGIICEGVKSICSTWKMRREMEIFRHSIKTNFKTVPVIGFWYSVIRIKSPMSST